MFKKLFKATSLCLMALVLMSADQHFQTTAEPDIQLIQIHLAEEVLDLYLNAPGVHYEKRDDGTLKFLRFQHTTSYYRISFHKPDMLDDRERPALVQRFRVFDGKRLLHGASRSLDREGNILSESNWDQGRLHGPHKNLDENLQLREIKHYQHGLPVGKWQSFYMDGTLATETVLPENYEQWQKSYIPGYEEPSNQIALKSYFHPLPITSTYYSHEGKKQCESQSRAHLTATGFVILPPHHVKVFDKRGKLSRHVRGDRCREVDSLIVENYGARRETTTNSINSTIFKSTTLDRPIAD